MKIIWVPVQRQDCLSLLEGSAGEFKERCGIICTLLTKLPKGFLVVATLLSHLPTTSLWGCQALQEKERPQCLSLKRHFSLKIRAILCWGWYPFATGMAPWSDKSFPFSISLIDKIAIWPNWIFSWQFSTAQSIIQGLLPCAWNYSCTVRAFMIMKQELL